MVHVVSAPPLMGRWSQAPTGDSRGLHSVHYQSTEKQLWVWVTVTYPPHQTFPHGCHCEAEPKNYRENVLKERKLVFLQGKCVFISPNWPVILGRFQFQFMTFLLSLSWLLLLPWGGIATSFCLTACRRWLWYFNHWAACLPEDKGNMQKPAKNRVSDAGTGSVPTLLTQTGCRHPFVVLFSYMSGFRRWWLYLRSWWAS